MAYSTPLTAVANATLTAAQWNASVRDNILETAPAKFTAAGRIFVSTGTNAGAERAIESNTVATFQTSASTSYGALATAGPAVTLTTGVRAITIITTGCTNTSSGNGVHTLAAIAISGATTSAADDTRAASMESGVADIGARVTAVHMYTTLTGGSNTFTLQYRVISGTGGWDNRHIVVIGL